MAAPGADVPGSTMPRLIVDAPGIGRDDWGCDMNITISSNIKWELAGATQKGRGTW